MPAALRAFVTVLLGGEGAMRERRRTPQPGEYSGFAGAPLRLGIREQRAGAGAPACPSQVF
ncbi:MAG TPA: hypothetical protein VKF40_08310 [Burkholderiales bacterium]|nr:hypothetical protein [Burkholderiales bacterium]